MDIQAGFGQVPRLPLLQAATKALQELPAKGILPMHTINKAVDFSRGGLSVAELKAFLAAAADAARKTEACVESGNTRARGARKYACGLLDARREGVD